MRVLVYATFVTVLTILGGCHGKQEYEIIYLTEDVARRDLVGKVVEIPDLDVPSMVYYRDSSLYFIDYKSMESQLYVYDFRDHSTSGFIRRGRGPGEMLGAYSAAFVCDGGQEKMVVYDIAQGDMLQADVNSLKSDGYYPEQHYGKFSIFMKVWSITGYGDKVLGLGNFDDARVIEFFGEDSLKVVSDYLPNLRESSVKKFVMQAYTGIIKANVSRHSCVIACLYADQIEIVDIYTGIPVFVKGPENFEPEITVENQSLAHSPNEKIGYVDVCCDEDYIYALYSGRKISERNSSYGRTVRVLDWNGKFEYEYILDRDILSIDYSPDEHSLYGISSLMEIVKYEL